MYGSNDRKRKVLQQDVDTDDKEERDLTQQPRAKFAAMDPSADQGDLMDVEVPGASKLTRLLQQLKICCRHNSNQGMSRCHR
ncbi:hypothetical protein WJX77_003851 [Trebouxia sp. C0004]